jgi:hypothetical protein
MPNNIESFIYDSKTMYIQNTAIYFEKNIVNGFDVNEPFDGA